MHKLTILFALATIIVGITAQNTEKNYNNHLPFGSAFDEIVVESTLNVRKKADSGRQARSIYLVAPQGRLYRFKRQNFGNFGGGFGGDYGSSSALANANSQGQYWGPQGFGASAGSAQGQAFESHGPLGGFGAAASGAQTQGFNVGPDGFRGSAGLSGGQSYNLPDGHTLSLTYSGDYAVGPDGKPTSSQGNSIAFTR